MPSTADFNRSCASEFGQENNFCSEKFEGGMKSSWKTDLTIPGICESEFQIKQTKQNSSFAISFTMDRLELTVLSKFQLSLRCDSFLLCSDSMPAGDFLDAMPMPSQCPFILLTENQIKLSVTASIGQPPGLCNITTAANVPMTWIASAEVIPVFPSFV